MLTLPPTTTTIVHPTERIAHPSEHIVRSTELIVHPTERIVHPTELVIRPTTPAQPAIQIPPHNLPRTSPAALMTYTPLYATATPSVPSPRPRSGPARPAACPVLLVPKTSGSRARKISPAHGSTNTHVISYLTQADSSTPYLAQADSSARYVTQADSSAPYLTQADTPTTSSRALLTVPHLSPSSSSGSSSLPPGPPFGDGSFACLATIMDLPRPVALARTDQDGCYTTNEISSSRKLDLIWAVLRETSRFAYPHTDLSKGGE